LDVLDVVLAILVGVVTLVIAYLGVHVTLYPAESNKEKREYKVAFSVLGLLACAIIGLQTYRNDQSQEALKSQVSRLQSGVSQIATNTKQPPRVEVNIPATIPNTELRAWLQVTSVYSPSPHVIMAKIRNFGQIPAFNIRLRQAYDVDYLGKGREMIFSGPGTAVFQQISSTGEETIDIGTDNQQVQKFLADHLLSSPFLIRVHGNITYSDTKSSKRHNLSLCYADIGFFRPSEKGQFIECDETGSNVSR
jgi:hypothetical protein